MSASLGDVEAVVRTVAQIAVDNEKYFGDLDAVVGDGDFGYSMARGFELVLRTGTASTAPIGTFLKKVASSSPAASAAPRDRSGAPLSCAPGPHRGRRTEAGTGPSRRDAARRHRRDQGPRPVRRWATRRCSTRWCPRWTRSRSRSASATTRGPRCAAAAVTARERAEATRSMQAMRGRASYTGERSIGTLDAGAVAVAVMFRST